MAVFILLGLEEDAICKIIISTKRKFKVSTRVRDSIKKRVNCI